MSVCVTCGRIASSEDLLVRDDGELVCEPCFSEGAKAEQRRDSIDAAWAAVEATLPKGWVVGGVFAFETHHPGGVRTWRAEAFDASDEGPAADAVAETPTRALRALARRLAEAT